MLLVSIPLTQIAGSISLPRSLPSPFLPSICHVIDRAIMQETERRDRGRFTCADDGQRQRQQAALLFSPRARSQFGREEGGDRRREEEKRRENRTKCASSCLLRTAFALFSLHASQRYEYIFLDPLLSLSSLFLSLWRVSIKCLSSFSLSVSLPPSFFHDGLAFGRGRKKEVTHRWPRGVRLNGDFLRVAGPARSPMARARSNACMTSGLKREERL